MAVIPPTLVGAVSSGRTGPPDVPFRTLDINHIVPAGADVLVAFVINNSFANEAPEVSWLGTRMELVHAPPGGMRPFLYQLINPTPGAGIVNIFHNHPFGTDISAVVFQVKDFGGFRWAESTWIFSFDPDPDTIRTRIYAESTDLVLSFFAWPGSGLTVTPDAGQVIIADQSGATGAASALAAGRVLNPVSVGNPPNALDYTETVWDVSGTVFNTVISNYMLAINGWDRDAPTVGPAAIARVTDSLTLEQQPPQAVPLDENPWTWRHEIPENFTTLVVLYTFFDSGTAAVYYVPDGGSPIPLTALSNEPFSLARAWILEGAPVGLGYIRTELSTRRWCGASAYSISGENVTADIFRGGIDPPQGLNIATTPGNIVVDRIGVQVATFVSWTPIAPQLSYYVQPLYGGGNDDLPFSRTATTGSNSGASSWQTAIAASTNMGWVSAPSVGFSQVAFTFLPIIPPPPECPGTRGQPVIDGLPYVPPDFPPCDEGSGNLGVQGLGGFVLGGMAGDHTGRRGGSPTGA